MQIKKEEVRKKILKAAIKEFKISGYKGATMRKISNTSGIPIGNLYRYYQNKETLFNSIVKDVYDELKDLFKNTLSDLEETSENKGLFFFDELIKIYTKDYDRVYILLNKGEGTKYENAKNELNKYFETKIITNAKIETPDISEEDIEFVGFIGNFYLIAISQLMETYEKDLEKLNKIGRRFIKFYSREMKERMEA